jgi:hypothetical protein
VSEQMAEQTSGEPSANSAGTGPIDSSAAAVSGAMAQAAAVIADSPSAPATGAAPADIARDTPNADAPKVDATKTEAPKLGAYTADTPKIDAANTPGKILVMSPSRDNTWRENVDPEPASTARKPGLFGKRRAGALAAVIALAAVAGALGGALATAGFGRPANDETRTASARALQDSILRLETDVAALRASYEHSSKLSVTQFNKTSERLDKVEKAQAEPAAKLAKISEAVERLRATPAAAPAAVATAPVTPRETTASISPPAAPGAAGVPVPAPKPEMARLPTVEGWILRDVADGGAVIEGRRGAFEVFAGDTIPGLGRVEAIRRQDGRWVVVTSKGLVVAR